MIAVAITLLALDLLVLTTTAERSLAHRLGVQWPSYVALVVSFMTIGIIWINHHATLRRIAGVDHAILMLNRLLLMTICASPFTTSLMATYLPVAATPITDPDAATEEAIRSVRDLGALGLQLEEDAVNLPLHDDRYAPLFAAMKELGAGVWLHPFRTSATPGSPPDTAPFLLWQVFG